MQQGFVLFQFKVTLWSDTPLFGLAQKIVVHHSHVLFYYNELCSYTARFKTCQENSIFSVYASVLLTTESSHFNGLSPIILLGTPFLS